MDRGFRAPFAAAFAALLLVYAGVVLAAGATPWQAARNAFAAMAPNALLALVSLRVARLVPWRPEGRHRFLVVHAAAVLGLALLATMGWALLAASDSWLVGEGFVLRTARVVVVFEALVSGLIQIGVMGAAHAALATERLARADALRARAELAALRSQLNPHFVLNTLHGLIALVRRDPARTEAALERLGGLLQFGLRVHHPGLDYVAFREEWAFAESYLALEQIRLGERLRVSVAIEEEALGASIPPFSLQPLIENAVLHAIAPRRDGGRLHIAASRAAGRLRVVVEDDGPGTTEPEVAASPRLGLRLLRERLLALYGAQARLRFERGEPHGLRVVLDLPEGEGEAA